MRSIARSSNSFKSEEWTTYVDTWMVSRSLFEVAIHALGPCGADQRQSRRRLSPVKLGISHAREKTDLPYRDQK